MIPTINTTDFNGKRVLVRLDIDIPLKDGQIVDDTRLRRSIPTLKALFKKGAKQLVLMGHVGRPKGKAVPELKTDKIALRLMQLLGKTVQHVDDCIDVELPDTPVVLLENLRFHAGEEANNPEFAKKLAQNGDMYVNDAFATCHRAHASMVGVPAYLPSCVGPVVERELEEFALDDAERPLVAILGGAKLETKLAVINKLLTRVDKLLLGGAMIFTFYKAKGWEIGDSLLDEKNVTMAQMLANNDKILLPTDVVVAPSPEEGATAKTVIANGIPAGQKGLDIGAESVAAFKDALSQAKTVVWNGPLGYVEAEPFDHATKEIAEYLAELTDKGIKTIIGGGDSTKIINALGLAEKFTHVSTGGGASMTLLEGKPLVAIQALER